MVEVQVNEKESFERALRRLKNVGESWCSKGNGNRSFYEKPSDAKRGQKKDSKKN